MLPQHWRVARPLGRFKVTSVLGFGTLAGWLVAGLMGWWVDGLVG